MRVYVCVLILDDKITIFGRSSELLTFFDDLFLNFRLEYNSIFEREIFINYTYFLKLFDVKIKIFSHSRN